MADAPTTILVVEDETDLNQMMADYLTSQGYRTIQAYDGAGAIATVFQEQPGLIVLDLNLPRLDGLEVARTVIAETEIPIIIVSARGEEEDRLAGFNVGVDDYVVKPFSLAELSMRIGAVLRRSAKWESAGRGDDSQPIVVGSIVVDPARRVVTVGGHTVELTAAQFSILYAMARYPGRVFTRLQLLETFQDHAFAGYERTVDVHVGKIRKQIERDPRNPEILRTVWGVGYRIVEGL